MKRFLLIISIIFFRLIAFSQDSMRILTYGFPDVEKQNAKSVIAEKWGIEFYDVGGCMVEQDLIDSAERNNRITERNIQKKYGKNWLEKFNAEVEVEYKKERKVSDLIDSLPYIKKKQAEMQRAGNGLSYGMFPVKHSTKYDVFVQGWGIWNGKSEWVIYYKLIVDYKLRSVKLLSDQIAIQ